ncbi:hypothetical protein [Mucisphaera calidilacus]|uniref:Uncharacterized protein n=1 Tax=Mucisphaera calidilacus TaxID=2527982 RepID=A0A518C0S3_9BACT|nr:hypothetical protein [Mucisphaera calidilacus]QDU72829.1 hypothetical protein Pan265_27040 [Mucisphaera calidilacus]
MLPSSPKGVFAVSAAALSALLITASTTDATQTFYLDFDTVIDGVDDGSFVPGVTPGIPPADEIYAYSPEQRSLIVEYLNSTIGLYDIVYVDGLPAIPGAGSVIQMNKGFGAGAEGIDFRNLDDDDGAGVNMVSIYKFLSIPPESLSIDDVAISTANTIGHESLHLMGARHHDAYGPIGTGIGTFPTDFTPVYPGPVGAPMTDIHFMSAHAGGSGFGAGLFTPKFVGERTAIKLEVAKPFSDAFVDAELGGNNAVPDAQFVDVDSGGFLMPYPPHPFPEPDRSTPGTTPAPEVPVELTGVAKVVTGSFDPGFLPDTYASDYYEFFGFAGEAWTFEVMSKILEGGDRYLDNADPAIIILDSATTLPVPYYTDPFGAGNDDDDDGELGASVIDLILPFTGFYTIEVLVAGPFYSGPPKSGMDGGSYELFMYTAETTTAVLGDFNIDGVLTIDDLDLLIAAFGSFDPFYELAGDPEVNDVDLLFWLEMLFGTVPGDANLDRKVDLLDLSALASFFGLAEAGWSGGDFNADGVTDLLDLSQLASAFGFDGSEPLIAPTPGIPEPSSLMPLGLLMLTRRRAQ